MKNAFHVAHFHTNMVVSTRNMFKEVKVPKSRGALGTGFTHAPVLLFELYLAINNSSTSHSPRRKNTSTLRVITLQAGRSLLYVEPAVNRQPGFRRELVEQITSFIIISLNFLHGELLKHKFWNQRVFIWIFHENSKISSFFQHFGEETHQLFTKVRSRTKADTSTESNFNMILIIWM